MNSMNKFRRYAIVISVVENLNRLGSWCGETHIQKTIYFLKKLFPDVIDYPFILYKYGPFSFDLHDDIGIMVADRYLKTVPMFPYGSKILAGELAEKIKGFFPKTLDKNRAKIEFITQQLANKNVTELEALGTALYITKDKLRNANIRKKAETLCELKPHIPFDIAKKAVEEVDKIIQSSNRLYRL